MNTATLAAFHQSDNSASYFVYRIYVADSYPCVIYFGITKHLCGRWHAHAKAIEAAANRSWVGRRVRPMKVHEQLAGVPRALVLFERLGEVATRVHALQEESRLITEHRGNSAFIVLNVVVSVNPAPKQSEAVKRPRARYSKAALIRIERGYQLA